MLGFNYLPPELVRTGVQCLLTYPWWGQVLYAVIALGGFVLFFLALKFIGKRDKTGKWDVGFIYLGVSFALIISSFLVAHMGCLSGKTHILNMF